MIVITAAIQLLPLLRYYYVQLSDTKRKRQTDDKGSRKQQFYEWERAIHEFLVLKEVIKFEYPLIFYTLLKNVCSTCSSLERFSHERLAVSLWKNILILMACGI